MSRNFAFSLFPAPVRPTTSPASCSIRRQRIPSAIRLRSSGAMRFSQRGFGTTPNIAPPSSFCPPAWMAWTVRRPIRRVWRSGGGAVMPWNLCAVGRAWYSRAPAPPSGPQAPSPPSLGRGHALRAPREQAVERLPRVDAGPLRVAQEPEEDLRGGARVADGAMAPVNLDAVVARHGIEVPAGQVREEAARQAHRAELRRRERTPARARDALVLGLQEVPVEARVVRHEDAAHDVLREVAGDLAKPRRASHHRVADPREARDGGGNRPLRI